MMMYISMWWPSENHDKLIYWLSNIFANAEGCSQDLYTYPSLTCRGGQIIRNSRSPRPQRVALHCGQGPTWTRRGADGESAKTRKTRKKRGQRGKTRTVQEKCASAEELSPVDPTNVICSSWTRNGEIRSTGLLLATFNKVHILTY